MYCFFEYIICLVSCLLTYLGVIRNGSQRIKVEIITTSSIIRGFLKPTLLHFQVCSFPFFSTVILEEDKCESFYLIVVGCLLGDGCLSMWSERRAVKLLGL